MNRSSLRACCISVPRWRLYRGGSGGDRLPGRCGRNSGLLTLAIVAGGRWPSAAAAGLVDTPAATASLLLNMELVATVVLAATLFREHLGRNMIVAALLVTTAGVLLVWDPGATVNVSALFIVGACACWGLDNSVTSRIDQVSPQHVAFLKGVVRAVSTSPSGWRSRERATSAAGRS